MRTTFGSTFFPRAGIGASLVSLALVVSACSSAPGGSATAPSAVGGTLAAAPSAGATVVSYPAFDASTLTLTVKTTTTSAASVETIDSGKIQLQILVDGGGNPVPCGTAGASWVRFDGTGGGLAVSSGTSTDNVDLDNLAATTGGAVQNTSCGHTICIRAHYVPGGGSDKVAEHFSAGASYFIACEGGCTFSQGYWRTHGPTPTGGNSNEWPVTSLDLGTVSYTDAQLLSILSAPVEGNGLISLAHQLIAAKLNIANGADGSAIAAQVTAADVLIGGLVVPPVGSGSLAPSATSSLESALEAYNTGLTGPGHCASETNPE
jgi:hypothetical protein